MSQHRTVSPLSYSLRSACCSQVGCQVLRKILLIPPWCSDRVRAVRAAVVLPPARAPRTTRSAADRREGRDRRGALVPMHAHSHPAGGTITFDVIVNSGRVIRAPLSRILIIFDGCRFLHAVVPLRRATHRIHREYSCIHAQPWHARHAAHAHISFAPAAEAT